MRMLRLAVVLLLALPATAQAADGIWSRTVPVGHARVISTAVTSRTFDLVGLHWRGSGTVSIRTRSVAGTWSGWRSTDAELEDGPDPGSREAARTRGWRVGSPVWVGPSDRIQYRSQGRVSALRAWFVWTTPSFLPFRLPAIARRVSQTVQPQVIARSAWQADERIVTSKPRYAPSVRFAVVHHTAGSSPRSPQESAAMVRAIELYHVKGNGWNDIGYNFLVDPFGQVFEGRAGGIERNVIGAHASGFNTGSVGIAVIGTYGTAGISVAARAALVQLLAWRLDVAHADPLGSLSASSGGNARFAAGAAIPLRTIDGHRDTGFTSCPGDALYRELPSITAQVATTGLPKIYEPRVTGRLGTSVAFAARLSAFGPWSVTIRAASGATVARGSGLGRTVAWTWNAVSARGPYTWAIEAGATARPATGSIGAAAPPTLPAPPPPPPAAGPLAGLTVSPSSFSPDGDGVDDAVTVAYTLAARSAVTATVADASGAVVATLFTGQTQSARAISFAWTGSSLPDGRYTLTVAAQSLDGRVASAQAAVAIDRTLGAVTAAPTTFSPNGDGANDTLAVMYILAGRADVSVRIERSGVVLATLQAATQEAGTQQTVWAGGLDNGTVAPDGAYDLVVVARSAIGETRRVLQVAVDRRA